MKKKKSGKIERFGIRQAKKLWKIYRKQKMQRMMKRR